MASTSYDAWQLGERKGIESLTPCRRSMRSPGAGEVLIRVRACSLNHRDLFIAAGTYGGPQPVERVPLGDGAGDVVELGAGVTHVKTGMRVTCAHFTSWLDGDYHPGVFAADAGVSKDGWLSQYAIMPAAALIEIPGHLSFEQAAALPAAGVTAWRAIHTFGKARPGDTVLTLGTGGVSIMALQIAKLHGARTIITSSDDAKLERAQAMGADIVINHRRVGDWDAAVLDATDGLGADIVVETVGLSTLARSINCCAPNARVCLLGSLAPPPADAANLYRLIAKNALLLGITSGSRAMLVELMRAAAVNNLQPRIDRVFDFADARAAYEYLEAARHFGKVVIRLN